MVLPCSHAYFMGGMDEYLELEWRERSVSCIKQHCLRVAGGCTGNAAACIIMQNCSSAVARGFLNNKFSEQT